VYVSAALVSSVKVMHCIQCSLVHINALRFQLKQQFVRDLGNVYANFDFSVPLFSSYEPYTATATIMLDVNENFLKS